MLPAFIACTAALAFVGAYRTADSQVRATLRLAGATALWAALITLLIVWS